VDADEPARAPAREESPPVLSVDRFYAAVGRYMDAVDPGWAEDTFQAQAGPEHDRLDAALGAGAGRSALDCACGSGGQALPLARLGWRVTASDVCAPALTAAADRAGRAGLDLRWHQADMREVGGLFPAAFDLVVCCMALDNLVEDQAIAAALGSIRDALAPGGRCYVRQRDFDTLLAARPRYEFREERAVPGGRVIRLEDWAFDGEKRAVCTWAFLREDRRRPGYAWETTAFAWRRRALRKVELGQMMADAGLVGVRFLPQASPWSPYEVIAERPGS
jgi:glycine/sarcosine N-methyltransferase